MHENGNTYIRGRGQQLRFMHHFNTFDFVQPPRFTLSLFMLAYHSLNFYGYSWPFRGELVILCCLNAWNLPFKREIKVKVPRSSSAEQRKRWYEGEIKFKEKKISIKNVGRKWFYTEVCATKELYGEFNTAIKKRNKIIVFHLRCPRMGKHKIDNTEEAITFSQ